MDAVLYDKIDEFQNKSMSSFLGYRAMGLDVGGTLVNLTKSDNTITPTNTPYAGYLLKQMSRINLDRLTFPKIYKPANTKCQVDVCGAVTPQDFMPVGTVFGSHFDGNTTDFIGGVAPESNTSTSDTTNKVFGTASRAFNGSQFIQYIDSELWNVGSTDWYVDFRLKVNSAGVLYYVCGQMDSAATLVNMSFHIAVQTDNTVRLYAHVGSTQYVAVGPTLSGTSFHHIRCGRNGGNLYVAVNGTVGTAVAISGTINNSAYKFCIGRAGEYATSPLNGNIDEFIFVKGQPMNSTNFAIPTSAYGLQAVASQSITLPASASVINNKYKDNIIIVTSGTGAGQTRKITAYNGSTKVATLDQTWTTTPTTASGFTLYDGIVDPASFAEYNSCLFNISPGFDFSTIDYTVNPTVNVICSLEKQAGATASPSMGVPITTSIERDWESQAPVYWANATTTYTTVLSSTGRTKIDGISSVSGSQYPILKITVDGVVKFLDVRMGTGGVGPESEATFSTLNIIAQNSVLIEAKASASGFTGGLVSYSK